jgi:hypothetical protein
VRGIIQGFLGEGTDARGPRANPLYADLSGFGPLYIQAGGDETLPDDARLLYEHAKEAGVDARVDIFPGMLHTFQMAAGRAPEADDAFEGRSSVRTWLYRIATNACLTALEQHGRRALPSGLGSPAEDPDALQAQQNRASRGWNRSLTLS